MQDNNELARECEYLCRSIFGRVPDRQIGHMYIQANRTVFSHRKASPHERYLIDQCVVQKLDAEAAELFLRMKSPKNALSQKAHIISYLLETNPKHYSVFINETRACTYAWATLTFFIARSVIKTLKGLFIILRIERQLARRQEATDV